jgi:hypothetical protein
MELADRQRSGADPDSQEFAMGKNIWVSPRAGGWTVKKEGARRASAVVPKRKDAIDIARRAAADERSELVIQSRRGSIRHKDSHGADGYPPRG